MYTILDLDGTISDDTWRRDRIPSQVDDSQGWDYYHEGSIDDKPMNIHLVGYKNIVITSRPCKFRTITMEWLAKNGVEYTVLLMRNQGDIRPAWQVKQDALQYLRDIYDIHNKDIDVAYDDNEDVCAMYKRQGINCVKI